MSNFIKILLYYQREEKRGSEYEYGEAAIVSEVNKVGSFPDDKMQKGSNANTGFSHKYKVT